MNDTPIRVGIIGVHPDQGWASTAHLPALKALPQYQVQAVSHHDAFIAKAAAEKFAREKPLQALLTAFGVGFLVGVILKR